MIDDVVLKAYRETIDPKSPNITLFSPVGAPAPYWAETGFVTDAPGVKTPNRQTLWSADATTLTAMQAGDADLGQRRRAEVQARHRRRRQIHVHRSRLGRERRRRAGFAAPLRADPAPRQARRRRLRRAARGLRRRHRRRLGAGDHLRQHREGDRPRPRAQGRRRLARLHRQILGARRSSPSQTEAIDARFSASGTAQPEDYQTDFVGPAIAVAPGATGSATCAGVRRREGSGDHRRLRARTSASRSSI